MILKRLKQVIKLMKKQRASRLKDGMFSDNELYTNDDAKDMQRHRDHSKEDEENLRAQHNKDGLSEAEQEQQRIDEGLPPLGSIPPTYKDEEGNDVTAKWNPETHRWIRPSTLMSGSSGGSGHFDTMNNDGFMHFDEGEFDKLMGFNTANMLEGGVRTTNNGHIIVHKDKDGNLNLHANTTNTDKYLNNTLNTGKGVKNLNQAKRGAQVNNLVQTILNDREVNPSRPGKKNVYESGTRLQTAFGATPLRIKRGKAKGMVGRRGSVEVKDRTNRPVQTETTPTPIFPKKIPIGSASRALRRITDSASNAIRNRDSNKLEARARKYIKQQGRKPKLDYSNPITAARLDKFTPEQREQLKQVIDVSGNWN